MSSSECELHTPVSPRLQSSPRQVFGKGWQVLKPREGDHHMCFRQHHPDGTYKWYMDSRRAKEAGAWD